MWWCKDKSGLHRDGTVFATDASSAAAHYVESNRKRYGHAVSISYVIVRDEQDNEEEYKVTMSMVPQYDVEWIYEK
jgi:hypothetical protein